MGKGCVKLRKNITNQIKAKSKDRFTRFSAAALLASILLLISSALLFAGVINTRQNRIHELGERSIATGNTVAISLRSFQLARLRSLMASPEQNDTFRSVSAYLTKSGLPANTGQSSCCTAATATLSASATHGMVQILSQTAIILNLRAGLKATVWI